MQFERLWAPWRLGYIKGEEQEENPSPERLKLPPGADAECFICRGLADSDDRRNLIVQRGTTAATILNRYPYNNGHLLVAPCAHKSRLDELTTEEGRDLFQTITKMTGILERQMNAEGFNIGLNLGRAAGAGLPGHLHWHIVPRWAGDTNFMPTLAQARVIPESLDELWQWLTTTLAESS